MRYLRQDLPSFYYYLDCFFFFLRKDNSLFSGVMKNVECGLTAAAWNPDVEHELIIGDRDGKITVIDVRKPNTEPLYKCPKAFSREIHRLSFNPVK